VVVERQQVEALTESISPCSGCGLTLPGGTEACQRLFEELTAREYEELGMKHHWTVVDIYALQHPDRYCVSAKSFAAHFIGLAWTMEYGQHPSKIDALRGHRRNAPLPKPELPQFRGALTIADLRDARDAEAFAGAVERWARSTWAAYAGLHELARRWIEEVLAEG
jgi:hypothetical protein